jgi:molybdopterin synthase catalytic subunit
MIAETTIPRVTIVMSAEPLEPPPVPAAGCGAIVDFCGMVRAEENGEPIAALEYQAYRPMAEREMERIARGLLGEFPCVEVYIAHRFGVVPVNEAAIVIRASARHRGEALSFVAGFMDRLKADVPIWKVRAIPG